MTLRLVHKTKETEPVQHAHSDAAPELARQMVYARRDEFPLWPFYLACLLSAGGTWIAFLGYLIDAPALLVDSAVAFALAGFAFVIREFLFGNY